MAPPPLHTLPSLRIGTCTIRSTTWIKATRNTDVNEEVTEICDVHHCPRNWLTPFFYLCSSLANPCLSTLLSLQLHTMSTFSSFHKPILLPWTIHLSTNPPIHTSFSSPDSLASLTIVLSFHKIPILSYSSIPHISLNTASGQHQKILHKLIMQFPRHWENPEAALVQQVTILDSTSP